MWGMAQPLPALLCGLTARSAPTWPRPSATCVYACAGAHRGVLPAAHGHCGPDRGSGSGAAGWGHRCLHLKVQAHEEHPQVGWAVVGCLMTGLDQVSSSPACYASSGREEHSCSRQPRPSAISRLLSACLCCSGRDERTFMKMLVHVPTNRVVGCHMVRLPALSDCCCCWGCWRGAAGALVEGDVGVAG